MKSTSFTAAVAALILAGALAGCGPKETEGEAPASGSAPAASTVATGQPQGSLKVGGRAVCAICAVKEGTDAPEEVKAVLDYRGKSYGFCDESEKAEFISEPAKYAQ